VAAELILPPLAHAGKHRALFENDDNRWGDYDRAKENGASRWGDHDRDNDKDRPIPVVPEANSGWVLVLFSRLSSFFRRDGCYVRKLRKITAAESDTILYCFYLEK